MIILRLGALFDMGTKVILTSIESRIASDGHACCSAFSPVQRILNVENCRMRGLRHSRRPAFLWMYRRGRTKLLDMKATAEKTEAVVKEVTLQGVADKREILEAYFQKKIWGKREHNFANGVKTAAEAALRPQKGRVL